MTTSDRRLNLTDGNLIDAADSKSAQLADQPGPYLVHDAKLRLAIDVALVTRRALLLEGPSGGGKSALAEAVARKLKWRFYREVITSRTKAQDLLWTVDYVRRIGDAQAARSDEKHDLSLANYVRPGVLWWAFDPESAATVGKRRTGNRLRDPAVGGSAARPAVVLLDEIDKADADMPNDLLVPLGSLSFGLTDLDPDHTIDLKADSQMRAVPEKEPLIIITSNQERDLAPAFLRRCVRHRLELPSEDVYKQIVNESVPNAERFTERLIEELVTNPVSGDKASIATVVDAARALVDLSDESDIGGEDRVAELIEVFGQWEPNETAAERQRY